MRTLSISDASKPLAGPVIPGWTQILIKLWPWRLEFDSLAFMLKGAQDYGNFYAFRIGRQPYYVVSDPELVRQILVERAREFHKADLVKQAVGSFAGKGLFTNEDDSWRRQRKLAQPAFHFQRIEAYGTTMVEQTQELLSSWRSGETLNIAEEMTKLTLGIVNKTLFNVDVRARAEQIGQLMVTILRGANDRINNYDPIWRRIFKGEVQREAKAQEEIFAVVDEIIAQHRQEDKDTGDLLSMLLAARDEEGKPMDEQLLRDEVITLFIAGHETTANALAWSFYLLSQHPAVVDRLLQELAPFAGKTLTVRDLAQLPYSEQVVKEAMRLYPPAGGVVRQPVHDIELAGQKIAKGTPITISTYNMHHDPKLFPDPERFDPDRFSPENEAKIPRYAYLPFGGGPRVCIGNSFAMMEARLILLTVLQRFQLSLAPREKVQAEQLFTLRPKSGLKMVIQAR
ncbi:MAG: cytochrome P450 [Caldilineaceae bacterium]